MSETSLVWLRRDLRLPDNTAISRALENSDKIHICFCFDTGILSKLQNKSDPRITFIYESLSVIDEHLKKLGAGLLVLRGDPLVEIPKLSSELKVNSVYASEDYEPSAKKRDIKVGKNLQELGVSLKLFKDHVIFRAEEVRKDDGTPYRVFTPYKKRWLSVFQSQFDGFSLSEQLNGNIPTASLQEKLKKNLSPAPRKLESARMFSSFPMQEIGYEFNNSYSRLYPAGFRNAENALRDYSENIGDYHKTRDFPAIEDGTSGLSPHLRFGTVSIRNCVRVAMGQTEKGADIWLSELIWREFYSMILDQFPHVEKHTYKKEYDSIKWPGSKSHYRLWTEGKTGYPIVDAGMRQLSETGWMHNRVRMVVASFLVKDLLCDWRWGEMYFSEKLMDYDLASNNGGWQWCASTGCDAQPYFRIFNPESQSRKFDPDGEYIRRWVVELRHLDKKSIHSPVGVKGYPEKIVDHKVQRRKALELYGKLK